MPLSWNEIKDRAVKFSKEWVPKDQLSYILGNPPFIGSKLMKQIQRDSIVNNLIMQTEVVF